MKYLLMSRLNASLVTLVVSTGFAGSVAAADEKDFSSKIGVVNSERIFKESNMAKASQAKLQTDFAKREKDLRDEAQKIKSSAEKLDKEAAVMAVLFTASCFSFSANSRLAKPNRALLSKFDSPRGGGPPGEV